MRARRGVLGGVRSTGALGVLLSMGLAACGSEGGASSSTAAGASTEVTATSTASSTAAPATTTTAPTKAVVRIGLERLSSPEAASLRGKRVGLIVNTASVTRTGRSSLQTLRAHGIRVRRLFSPEHGLAGKAGAGAAQQSGVDPRSGLPIVSLYGEHTKPTAADLAGLDALVFDLQDVGVRFYTYVSTEILAMEAAAEAGIPFVVLDRPNPLGGTVVAGPVREGQKTFVATAPGPLVHGLTAGEMARYVNAHTNRPARLTVIALEGWRREMTWPQTGRKWIAPSPGLRSAQAALVYPGTALFEGTTVSEGRGTATPFELICAPWLDVDGVIQRARRPDVRMTATTVVPMSSRVVPDPKFPGSSCRGIRLAPEGNEVNGFRAGLALLLAVRRAPQFRWTMNGATTDAVLGTPRLRRAVDRGASLDAILRSQAPAIRAWREQRADALLYP